MKEIYPAFYKDFKCIANRCEDSCCKDWDIDVDSETEKFYNTVQGALGDKIRSLTVTDEYGERVFRSTDGRCPFWNQDMLCDIYIGIGEEHLSRTCAKCSGAKVGIPSKRTFLDGEQTVSPIEKIPGSNTPIISPAKASLTISRCSAIICCGCERRIFLLP